MAIEDEVLEGEVEEVESETQDQGDDLGEAAEFAVDSEGAPLKPGATAGAAAPGKPAKEEPWAPPGKEEWDRLHRERDGFKKEMIEHRQGLRNLQERVQPFIDYYEQARRIDEAIAKDEAEKIPDATEDGLGHVVGRVGQLIRPIAEKVEAMEQARLDDQDARAYEAWEAQNKEEADADIARVTEEHPDWQQAMGHLANTMMAPLLERLPEEEARAVFASELAAVVKRCKEVGVSPADHFYLMAQQLNWNPGAAAPASGNGNGAPKTSGKLTAERQRIESMAGIAPLRGSSSSARLMPSAKDMASMSTEEWAAAVDQYGLDKLMEMLAEETGEA